MMKLSGFFEKQLKDFDDAACVRLLRLFSFFALCAILYATVFSGFQIVDEFEHLHASWLVSIGKIPYVDFFEHHHPLLWYLSAPIVKLFYNNAIIFYVMRGICFTASLLCVWFIYKIALFFGDKIVAWCAVAIYLGNLVTFYNFYQFRPDTFMNLCFICGLFFLFKHIQEKKISYLCISFFSFLLSFLFLQKIGILLLMVSGIISWLLFAHVLKFRPTLIAAIFASVFSFLYSLLLYKSSMLPEYIELNYNFNLAMISYFTRGDLWYSNIFLTIYGLEFLAALFFFRKENLYFKIISILFICEFLMRGFYFAPHPNYYTLLSMLGGLTLAVGIKRFMPSHKFWGVIIFTLFFVNLGHIINKLINSIDKYNSYRHYQLADFVHKNSEPNDLFMNGYDMNFNIYRADVSYYWFGLDMLLPIMKSEYNVNPVDVNALVVKYQPKFVYNRDYVDLKAMRTYGEIRYTQRFIPQILAVLYKPTPFDDLLILK